MVRSHDPEESSWAEYDSKELSMKQRRQLYEAVSNLQGTRSYIGRMCLSLHAYIVHKGRSRLSANRGKRRTSCISTEWREVRQSQCRLKVPSLWRCQRRRNGSNNSCRLVHSPTSASPGGSRRFVCSIFKAIQAHMSCCSQHGSASWSVVVCLSVRSCPCQTQAQAQGHGNKRSEERRLLNNRGRQQRPAAGIRPLFDLNQIDGSQTCARRP